MVIGLRRYQDVGDLHFVTFSCYRRQAYLRAPAAKDLFVEGLERIRGRYEFEVVGYVVMPEHIHLLVSEPCVESLAIGLQALKLSLRGEVRGITSGRPGITTLMFIRGLNAWKSRLHALESGETRAGGENGGLAVV